MAARSEIMMSGEFLRRYYGNEPGFLKYGIKIGKSGPRPERSAPGLRLASADLVIGLPPATVVVVVAAMMMVTAVVVIPPVHQLSLARLLRLLSLDGAEHGRGGRGVGDGNRPAECKRCDRQQPDAFHVGLLGFSSRVPCGSARKPLRV